MSESPKKIIRPPFRRARLRDPIDSTTSICGLRIERENRKQLANPVNSDFGGGRANMVLVGEHKLFFLPAAVLLLSK